MQEIDICVFQRGFKAIVANNRTLKGTTYLEFTQMVDCSFCCCICKFIFLSAGTLDLGKNASTLPINVFCFKISASS